MNWFKQAQVNAPQMDGRYIYLQIQQTQREVEGLKQELLSIQTDVQNLQQQVTATTDPVQKQKLSQEIGQKNKEMQTTTMQKTSVERMLQYWQSLQSNNNKRTVAPKVQNPQDNAKMYNVLNPSMWTNPFSGR